MNTAELNEEYMSNPLTEEETQKLFSIQQDFLKIYAASENTAVDTWLPQAMQTQLPEKTPEQVRQMSAELIDSLTVTEEAKRSHEEALSKGRSSESWLSSTLLQATSHMSAQESAMYLKTLDEAVKDANVAMHTAITTRSSGHTVVNMNPNLDGFIAEQHHVNSFNMAAAAKGSALHAEVLPPKPGETYSKNGFDIVIKDAAGNRIHQYQAKFGATAEDTIRMIKSGNYNNQVLVVPEEQVAAVQKAFPTKTVTSTIGDGNIQSKPLTKEQAKQLQEQAQNNNFMDADWNDFSARDLANGIAKNVASSSLMGAAIGAGMYVVKQLWNGEQIKGSEILKTALTSGADFGIKAAVAAGLKVAAEKGILSIIPKGTPASTYVNIAFVAIENVKILGKIASGELSVVEGLIAMEKTTVSCVAGIALGAKGAAIGAAIGSVLGPIGTAVGGFVGSAIGYIIGSKAGELLVTAAQKVRSAAIKAIKSIGNKIKQGVKNVGTVLLGV